MMRLREQRRHTLDALAGLSEEQLKQPASWRDRQSDVRFYLLRLAEGDDVRRVNLGRICAALGWAAGEAARILGLAAEAWGEIRGMLVGVPDEMLDREPAPGEWSVRQTLAHVEQTARRYLLHTAWAVERVHSEEELPMRMPEDRLPPTEPKGKPGEPLPAMLARIEVLHDEAVARLAGTPAEDMVAPTIWTAWAVDARFRLYRFAAHERQHGAQIGKTLAALGFVQSEAQMILGHAEIARGKLIGALTGLPDDLAGRSVSEGLPPVEALLEGAVTEEGETVATVLRALT